MTLSGTKNAGTDIHTVTAKTVNIDRNTAKVLNFARLYLCGKNKAIGLIGGKDGDDKVVDTLWKYTKGDRHRQQAVIPENAERYINIVSSKLSELKQEKDLAKFNGLVKKLRKGNNISKVEEYFLIGKMYDYAPRSRIEIKSTGDLRVSKVEWKNGVESELFNFLEEHTSKPEPTLPVLGGQLPKSMTQPISQAQFLTSRCNWMIQSSAVDFLHIFITNMEYLISEYGIDATYSISIHDMIQYISSNEDRHRCALAFQIAHMYTRAYFSIKCNLPQLPNNCAFFSSIEIDRCMRKDPSEELDHTLFGSDIPLGESLDINDIIKFTNGSLQK